MHISSSYAKILGQKLFRTWEIPRSGSKAKTEKKRAKVRNYNGQLRIATPPRVAHTKPPGPIRQLQFAGVFHPNHAKFAWGLKF